MKFVALPHRSSVSSSSYVKININLAEKLHSGAACTKSQLHPRAVGTEIASPAPRSITRGTPGRWCDCAPTNIFPSEEILSQTEGIASAYICSASAIYLGFVSARPLTSHLHPLSSRT